MGMKVFGSEIKLERLGAVVSIVLPVAIWLIDRLSEKGAKSSMLDTGVYHDKLSRRRAN